MSCYIVQEPDGSRFELEDESGFLLLEFCDEPAGGGELPMGERSALPQAQPPPTVPVYHIVRGAEEEEEIILYLLSLS